MASELYDFKHQLDEQGAFFCFCGAITQELVTHIGVILQQNMPTQHADKTAVSRVFSFVVEHAHNIMHYSDEQAALDANGAVTARFGILIIGYKDGHYFVLSGNLIEQQKIKRLRERLTLLHNMSKDELKHYYLERRRHSPEAESKGACLGLIGMAKKSACPLEFDFKTVDESCAFFSIKTTI